MQRELSKGYLLNLLRENKKKIKRNTLKTLRGQILSGDFEGAYKGINKLINKEVGEGNWLATGT